MGCFVKTNDTLRSGRPMPLLLRGKRSLSRAGLVAPSGGDEGQVLPQLVQLEVEQQSCVHGIAQLQDFGLGGRALIG